MWPRSPPSSLQTFQGGGGETGNDVFVQGVIDPELGVRGREFPNRFRSSGQRRILAPELFLMGIVDEDIATDGNQRRVQLQFPQHVRSRMVRIEKDEHLV